VSNRWRGDRPHQCCASVIDHPEATHDVCRGPNPVKTAGSGIALRLAVAEAPVVHVLSAVDCRWVKSGIRSAYSEA
jgi:hypothetical protein